MSSHFQLYHDFLLNKDELEDIGQKFDQYGLYDENSIKSYVQHTNYLKNEITRLTIEGENNRKIVEDMTAKITEQVREDIKKKDVLSEYIEKNYDPTDTTRQIFQQHRLHNLDLDYSTDFQKITETISTIETIIAHIRSILDNNNLLH